MAPASSIKAALLPSRTTTTTTTTIGVTTMALLLLILRFWKRRYNQDIGDQHADIKSLWKMAKKWMRQRALALLQEPSNTEDGNGGTHKSETTLITQSPILTSAAARNTVGIAPEPDEQPQQQQDDNASNHDNPRPLPPPPPTNLNANNEKNVTQHHIRQQQGRIREILRYWFGEYTPAEAQKKLWMITAQATEYRQGIDREILQHFGHLYLSEPTQDPVWREWCTDADLYGIHGKVAAIVLLDQFGRHVHRCLVEQATTTVESLGSNQVSTTTKLATVLPLQSALDQAALRVAQSVVNEHAADLALLSQAVQIFAYMPFRHANQLETVQLVQAQIQTWTDLHEQYAALLSRFRRATHRRLAVLQDEARRTGDGKGAASVFTHADILEAPPFHVDDMTPATQHVVYRTIQQFLTARGIIADKFPGTKCPVIVSLSGGVDSMVICAVLAHLAQTDSSPIHVVAVHIDYANRPESAAEAAFCRDWCADHGVDFYVRRIDEVTRGVTARDAYEKISRQVRYSFYRHTMERYNSQFGLAADQVIGVVLGHHRGDLRENVLSNAHKGAGPLDLSGMTSVSQNDGVTLYRPLLPLEKTAIFDYAHLFGVPYFKDTTPHWSTRGKLRNRLLPLLEEIYGEGCLGNLSNLAVESDECRDLLNKALFGPFMDNIQRKPMGMMFSTGPWKEQGLFFWKFVLREALHSGGMGMFSDKAVVSFLERVHAAKEGWLQCRKDYAVYLQRNGDVCVWKPDRFPWHKMDHYQVQGQTLGYGRDQATRVGPWRITALLVPIDDSNDTKESNDRMQAEIQTRLKCKALDSIMHLMDGSLKYYVQVPTWEQTDGSLSPRPLVFRKFSKPSRPLAWKNFDTRVQDTLPLVGNDDTALAALSDPIATGAVHVNEAGVTVPNPVELVKVSICLDSLYPPASPAKSIRG